MHWDRMRRDVVASRWGLGQVLALAGKVAISSWAYPKKWQCRVIASGDFRVVHEEIGFKEKIAM